jgi:transcriptional regulator with XRE-family HTH domain
MTLYDRKKNKLIEDLKNKEYRDAFVEESISVGISFQIKALREQRNLTQEDFEKKSGMKQSQVSLLENPNHSGFSIATLEKIAAIYDVGLMVRFVPISDLVKWELNLDSESLKALSYKDDPYFIEPEEKEGAVTPEGGSSYEKNAKRA